MGDFRDGKGSYRLCAVPSHFKKGGKKAMKTIQAQPITKENFKPFGMYYNLYEFEAIETPDFKCNITPEPIVNAPMHLGVTMCHAGDFDSISMERHFLTEEPQFCADGPMVLTVANSDPEQNPKEEDVRAFLMQPGDVAVLAKGIWHDANHAVDQDTMYYFLAENSDDPRETEWVAVQPEPVHVLVK